MNTSVMQKLHQASFQKYLVNWRIATRDNLMNKFKKIDIFLLSIFFSIVFWISESSINYIFFNEKYFSNNKISHPLKDSFLHELIHPGQNELSMCILVVSLMLLFGALSQVFINKQRFFATHDAITKAPNNRLIEIFIKQCLLDPNKKNSYIAVMKLDQLSLIHRILGIKYVNQLACDVVDRLKVYLAGNFIGTFLFSKRQDY